MIRRSPPLSTLLIAAALLIVGCGGSDQGADTEAPGDAEPEAAAVIEEWSDSLREGKLMEAARLFRIPSLVQNGTPPVDLESESEVLLFNASLPCGAELTETEQRDEYVIATFELTERPGAGECGSGVGLEARTAFRIEDGLIVEWRRLPNAPGSGDPAPDRPVI